MDFAASEVWMRHVRPEVLVSEPNGRACSLSALQRHTENMGTPMQDGVRLFTPTSESAYRGLETIQVLDTGEIQVVDAAKLRVAAASEPHDSR